MVDEKDFQERIQQIGNLITSLQTIPDAGVRSTAQALVQSVMELHAMAVDQMLQITLAEGVCGAEIVRKLGSDRLVSSLLALHGLHPEDLSTRVTRAVDKLAAQLLPQNIEVCLIGILDGDVRIRATARKSGHACGSTHAGIRAAIEESVYEAAPEIVSLTIEGLDSGDAGGFVSLDALINARTELTATKAGG